MKLRLINKGRRSLWIVTPDAQQFTIPVGSQAVIEAKNGDAVYYSKSYGAEGLFVEQIKPKMPLKEVVVVEPKVKLEEKLPEKVETEAELEEAPKPKRKPRAKVTL